MPDLLGMDPGARVLVLEYLAEPSRVPAREWMTDYAIALARLNAATGLADAGALPTWTGPDQADARAFADLASRLEVPVPRLLHRLTVVAALGADHPELVSLAQVSSAMRDKILARWPGIRELPVVDGDPLRGS